MALHKCLFNFIAFRRQDLTSKVDLRAVRVKGVPGLSNYTCYILVSLRHLSLTSLRAVDHNNNITIDMLRNFPDVVYNQNNS